MTAITPPERAPHGFSFTPVNLLRRYDPPVAGGAMPTRYTFTFDGEPETVARPDGQTLTAVYDRLSTVTRDGAPLVAYTYDANGNRLTETTSAGVRGNCVE